MQLEPVAPARDRVAQRAVGAVHASRSPRGSARARARPRSGAGRGARRATPRGSDRSRSSRLDDEPARQIREPRRDQPPREAAGAPRSAGTRASARSRREQCQHSWSRVSTRIIAGTLTPVARHGTDQTPNDEPQPQVRLTFGILEVEARRHQLVLVVEDRCRSGRESSCDRRPASRRRARRSCRPRAAGRDPSCR